MIRQHVAKIIKNRRVVGVLAKNFAEKVFCLLVLFLPLISGGPQELDCLFVLGFAGKLLGFVERGLGFLPALQAAVHSRQIDVHLAVFGRALQQ